MQRLRIRFTRGEEVKYISHLDITRLWQRAFQRADVPLSYSQGFNPHPQISLAVPLPVGVTSQAELMDALCTRFVSPHYFTTSVNRELPRGIEILQVYNIALTLPSLQSQVSFTEYTVSIETEKGQEEIAAAINHLLSRKELPWQHERDTGVRRYDLRALVDSIWLVSTLDGCCTVGMKLRSDSSGSGRPEQVSAALGFDCYPYRIHRTGLFLKTR
ncbi:MAG: TIGR03936 family radical SAM-associated protein [Chloroflexota bacterium]